MRTGVTVHLSSTDRKRLPAIVDDRDSPQKHVWRARIVLATAGGLGTAAVMRAAGVSKTAVWRWRFMAEGVDGLLSGAFRAPNWRPSAFQSFKANITARSALSLG